MKPVLIHEYLNQYGGAERVLQVLAAMMPNAPIYTTLYDRALTGGVFDGRTVRTSFIQNLPWAVKYHHLYSPLMPLAVEQFDLREFDTILSVSASFAKGVIVPADAMHTSYCLTPPRFLWDDSQRFVQDFSYPWFLRRLSPLALSYLRVWDRQAAQRVDRWVAISEFVRRRIHKYYQQDASVVYPPVNIDTFSIGSGPGRYWLMVGRLVAYKRFDVAIKAFNQLGWPLHIIGSGVEEARLRAFAGPNITFLNNVDDQELARQYSGCAALVFPQEEDFGIVPLEAMASGRPVVAWRGGGALETVVDRITGVFFDELTPEAIAAAVDRASRLKFLPTVCRGQAERFSVPIFRSRMSEIVQNSA